MIHQRCHFVVKRKPRGLLPRCIAECGGSAGIEYAVLIAIIVACAVGVCWQTGYESSGSFLPLAQALNGQDRDVALVEGPVVESSPVLNSTPSERWLNLIAVSLLGLAVGGWLIERRARLGRTTEATSASKEDGDKKPEPASECRSRLSEKRLRILNTLINDNHKLLPSDMKVGDLMTTDIKTASPKTSVADLRRLFTDNKFRHVLICDEARRLVGVVSDRDLKHVEDSAFAETLMATRPTTVSSDSRVNDAITLLLYGHISSLPVVDDARLVGIITTTDVVMTLQCTMLAVEQIVVNLRSGRKNKEFESLAR